MGEAQYIGNKFPFRIVKNQNQTQREFRRKIFNVVEESLKTLRAKTRIVYGEQCVQDSEEI